ncbi:MAG TPA: indolepyruvate ferredoxin oxidoreductase subunit alpha [Anaerolineae bacterium]|nr:indolepyruvate ferredoxin oxidoreductase subunit alpha [Anaerolineae bacterium]HQI83173.1 indolepyruvate ferredoxin oxidoreductase subunit alpha [Anaerolineae bacterium]
MKRLLSGNEAFALGAWEAGVQYAVAYPGTPSTEILENFARYPGIKAEWASNEKVALDNAIGASFGGARAIAVMKHVGVNVAADSLMSVSYTGVKGGLVLISADDPGAFSSQNEQDNRQYARFGKFPCFDPADSEEARQFMAVALDLSEQFKTPVLMRSTTRLSHSKSAVEATVPGTREFQPLPPFEREEEITRVILPAIARMRHPVIEQRLLDVAQWAETTAFERNVNRVEWNDKALGVVTNGIAYQYAREVLPHASILKLGMSYPLPLHAIRDFAAQVEMLIVLEELDPFIEDQLKAAGIPVAHGKDIFPLCGELTLANVRKGAVKSGLITNGKWQMANGESPVTDYQLPITVPPRPPALCPGCPHRAFFYALSRNKRKVVLPGDIGCYSMGVLPPFEAMDMLISMGAGIGMGHGFKQAGGQEGVVTVIGDSTFFHAGMAPLASAVYNKANIVVAILDNRITAMTGQQHHPGTGTTLQGAENPHIDIAPVVRALGVTYVEEVNAWDVNAMNKAIRAALKHEDGPAVLIVRGACVFTPHFHYQPRMEVDLEKCVACGSCFRVGCPAILKSEVIYPTNNKPKSSIDPLLCTGCTVCMQVCPTQAIAPIEEG